MKNPEKHEFLKKRKQMLKLAQFQLTVNPNGSFYVGDKLVLFSPCDIGVVSKYRWTILKKGNDCYVYAIPDCSNHNANIALAREIMGLKKGDKEVVDHINGNTLDNRRENLRVCSIQENVRNCKASSDKKYKYKGVVSSAPTPVMASVRAVIDGKVKVMTFSHTDEKVCATIFDIVSKAAYGEYARLNRDLYPNEFKSVKTLEKQAMERMKRSRYWPIIDKLLKGKDA